MLLQKRKSGVIIGTVDTRDGLCSGDILATLQPYLIHRGR